MSIAEKLTIIAENQRDVYNAGFAAGQAQGGGNSAFWDAYQQNGNRTDYNLAFAGIGWNAETFKPKYVIRPIGNVAYQMFARTGVETVDETVLDFSQVTTTQMAMYMSHSLKNVTIDTSSLTTFSDLFNYGYAIETLVLKNVPETCNFTGGFTLCRNLKNFTVTGTIGGTALNLSDSSLLTDASVNCIIEHLKDRTGTTEAKITLHKDVGAKLTQAQKDAISAKNWTLVY